MERYFHSLATFDNFVGDGDGDGQGDGGAGAEQDEFSCGMSSVHIAQCRGRSPWLTVRFVLMSRTMGLCSVYSGHDEAGLPI